MRLHIKGRFPAKLLANMILSAVSVTAAKRMNRFLGKAAVSILSESLQLPSNNKFVTDE